VSARTVIDTLFPVRKAPHHGDLHEEMKRIARAAERRFTRLSLAVAGAGFTMMAVRVAAAWWAGRL
jgi:hypothetical protein